MLTDYSLSGIHRLLDRAGLSYKRGRQHLHSPDPDYLVKRDRAKRCEDEARKEPGRVVAIYLDEMSYYRQPTVAKDWADRGSGKQARAEMAHKSNSRRRVVAAIDAVTGKVVYEQAYKIGVRKLSAFYKMVRTEYGPEAKIYVIQDNWFVHFHEDVLAAAEQARIEIVALPTYSPWLNPIEKLWRKLRQDVLHMHRLSSQWEELQKRVAAFLDGFAKGSTSLLHYVGLAEKLLPD